MKLKIKLLQINDKCIATQEFNKLTAEYFNARLAQANLASKNDIANFVKRQILIINWEILIKTLLQMKQNMCLLKMNQMNYQKKQYQQKD